MDLYAYVYINTHILKLITVSSDPKEEEMGLEVLRNYTVFVCICVILSVFFSVSHAMCACMSLVSFCNIFLVDICFSSCLCQFVFQYVPIVCIWPTDSTFCLYFYVSASVFPFFSLMCPCLGVSVFFLGLHFYMLSFLSY